MNVNQKKNRFGISLMEVLISIGVVSIGLLGVVSLIPVASQQAEMGARNDRKANVGRRSFREFNIRGFNEPGVNAPAGAGVIDPFWISLPAAPDMFYAASAGLVPQDALVANSYFLDPRALNTTSSLLAVVAPPGWTNSESLVRISLDSEPGDGALDAVLTAQQAEEIFVFKDDLEFDSPASNGDSPTQVFLQDTTMSPIKRYAAGKFSWAATLTPNWNVVTWRWNGVANTWDGLAADWTLSTLIMYARNSYSEPLYGTVRAGVTPGITRDGFYTSSDLRIQWSPTIALPREIKSGDWVMLAHDDYLHPAGTYAQTADERPVPARRSWFRVMSVGEVSATGLQDLTLAGDWDSNWDESIANEITHVIWIPEVVSVYTKSIRLDLDASLESSAVRVFN